MTAGGARWYVQRDGGGPVMLLIHGTGASTHTWRRMLPLLAASYTVVSVDLPGHGRTDAVDGAASSIGGMSRGLAQLLRSINLTPAYVVGHSAGAVILCRMSLDGWIAPRVIISINGAFVPLGGLAGVLFSPIARALASNALLPRLLARRAGNSASVARLLASTGSQLDADGVAQYTTLMRDPKHVGGALSMMGNWQLEEFARDLPTLSTPLVLLVGENDKTVPPRQAAMVAAQVKRAQVRRLPKLGHLAHEEAPLLVAGEIRSICQAFNEPEAEPADPCDRPTA